ncbi:S1 family peptidase [Sphingomonas sp. RHCKR47]|nr:S1 family peptidase [Sphingomonas citricola]
MPASPTTPSPLRQSAADAIAQDAGEYARTYGVTLAEAQARLAAQEETVPVTDAIAIELADRLAGIAIEHRPAYRIVVLLTGDAPVATRMVSAGGMTVPIVFRTGATATRGQLELALASHQAALAAAVAHPPGMGIDLATGTLVVIANPSDVDREGVVPLTARLSAIAGVPVRVRTDRVITSADMAAEGGARVVGIDPADGRRYACTTGFVVTDGARTGIATAAHCPDALSYIGPNGERQALPFVGQWGWGYQDVQINASDTPLSPSFFADTAKTASRTVAGRRALPSTRAGDIVCHRGERTGYSCAAVELVSFAPAGPLCGGACLPTWVSVAGPNCQGGDSGAPVFLGNRAFGLVKGGSYRGDRSCAFYFYMSTDYLPTGWRLLEDATAAPITPPAPPAPAPPPRYPDQAPIRG